MKGRHELFTTIGVPYGVLLIEDYGVANVYCMEDGKATLHKAVKKNVITTDHAGIVEAAMTEAGLVTDEREFVQKIKDFVLPADHNPSLSFKPHECDTINPPFPRGDIITDTGIPVKRIVDVWSGLEFCDKLIEDGKMRVLDGAAILKAAFGANLPLNADDIHRRWDALPEKTRREYDSAFAQLTGFDDVPGMGRILATGLPIPDWFFKEIKKLNR